MVGSIGSVIIQVLKLEPTKLLTSNANNDSSLKLFCAYYTMKEGYLKDDRSIGSMCEKAFDKIV